MRTAKGRAFQDAIFVRLFRLWAIGREEQVSVLPKMHKEALKHGYHDVTASACASLFELVEGHLGRRLVRECCCSPKFSSDEKALIGILLCAPALTAGYGSREVPHGLPAAISWAASCVCEAMFIELDPDIQALKGTPANRQDCPFGARPSAGAAHGQ